MIPHEDEWCAHPDHLESLPSPTLATGYRIEHFPSAHDVGITLQVSIPMCARHVKGELPQGIFEGEVRVVVNRVSRGRRSRYQ